MIATLYDHRRRPSPDPLADTADLPPVEADAFDDDEAERHRSGRDSGPLSATEAEALREFIRECTPMMVDISEVISGRR